MDHLKALYVFGDLSALGVVYLREIYFTIWIKDIKDNANTATFNFCI